MHVFEYNCFIILLQIEKFSIYSMRVQTNALTFQVHLAFFCGCILVFHFLFSHSNPNGIHMLALICNCKFKYFLIAVRSHLLLELSIDYHLLLIKV